MLAHASIPGFSGGFIGVDVFFVISGYLITGLLVEERDRTGRVDFRSFYARRIRRLAGALLAMVAVVSVGCILLLPEASQAGQAAAAFWSVLWSSNLHFAFLGVDCFDAATKANAFLHTWSLGVEEQFYLVWPVLILCACKGEHRWRVVLVSAVTLLSLAGCWWLASQRADQAYYLMPTRLWQLSIGALAWFLPVRMPWLRFVGILLILLSAGVISDAVSYPWPWALLPALGAAAIVSAGKRALDRAPVAHEREATKRRDPRRVAGKRYPGCVVEPVAGIAADRPSARVRSRGSVGRLSQRRDLVACRVCATRL